MKKITAEQIRAARAMLRMSAQDLATVAKIGVATVRRSEAETGAISATTANASAIQAALEAAGIEFLPEVKGEQGEGVRLRKGPVSPLSYFKELHPFEFEMPYGRRYFGVWRKPDEGYNRWSSLALLQLSNPQHDFESVDDIWPFWFDTLNTGTILQEILTKAFAQVSGPRKPDHPSKLHWDFFQPEDVYPGARRLFASLAIDWQADPAQIITNKTRTNLSLEHIDPIFMPFLGNYDWWRLDELNKS